MVEMVFCADPLCESRVDNAFLGELDVAEKLGFAWARVDLEALSEDRQPRRAAREVPRTEVARGGVYRGWMLKSGDYAALYQALSKRGLRLLNDPDAYDYCHHLPLSYEVIKDHTPSSTWIECESDVPMETVVETARSLGNCPIIVKDFVKSQKHYWKEACFIPSASDSDAVRRIVKRFIDLQGGELQGGLVFRELVELERIGEHPTSGMPLSKELRIFFVDGKPACVFNYWQELEYPSVDCPLDCFSEIAQSVRSRFFAMDVAKSRAGRWLVVELGDGQVSGIPESCDPTPLYRALADAS